MPKKTGRVDPLGFFFNISVAKHQEKRKLKGDPLVKKILRAKSPTMPKKLEGDPLV